MNETKPTLPDDYSGFLAEVRERIRSAQYAALKAVNKELVGLYWDIGQMIVQRQEDEGWGKSVVQQLSVDLQADFPGVRGYSAQNLWYMRQFFLQYREDAKLQPLVGEISWAKNLVIMGRCKDALEREFYIRMTRKFGWTKNVLIHQIENQSYEKSLLGQTNFDRALTPELRAHARLAVRDEYTFDFLELATNTASGSSIGRSLPESRTFCAPWADCSPSSAVSSGSKWTGTSISSTCCCSTDGCDVWSPSI